MNNKKTIVDLIVHISEAAKESRPIQHMQKSGSGTIFAKANIYKRRQTQRPKLLAGYLSNFVDLFSKSNLFHLF